MLGTSRRTFLGTAGAATAAMALEPTRAHAAPVPNRSKLAWRSGCATDLDPGVFERYRGRGIDVRTSFWRRNSWAGMRALDGLTGKLYPFGTAGREAALVTYYMFPDEQSPRTGGLAVWQMAASGQFDGHHRAIAAAIARFQGPFIFRVGHEWNGTSFPWGVTDPALAPLYKDYFRRIADILRTANPGSLIDWCCLKRGQAAAGIQTFYPGGDFVDFIGHDRYDRFPTFRTEADWASRYNETRLGGPVGMGAWLQYARSEGKKLSIAEWATASPASGSSGDNPFFVEKMLRFFSTNAADIGFECYFNRRAGSGGHHLDDNPRSSTVYRQLMASGGA